MSQYLRVSDSEYCVRKFVGRATSWVDSVLYRVYSKMRFLAERVWPFKKEYLLDFSTGSVRVVFTPKWRYKKMGAWKWVQGKPIRISDFGVQDKQIIYTWREVDNGRWDETFQCYVKDKDHYRQLLKEHKLRQYEPTRYCHMTKGTRDKEIKQETDAGLQSAFNKALSVMSESEKSEILGR